MEKCIQLLLIVTIVGTIAYSYYGFYIIDYINLMFHEEYTYLLILLPLVIYTGTKLYIRHSYPLTRISIENVVSSSVALSVAITMYALTQMNPPDVIQYAMLSIIFLTWSLVAVSTKFTKWWMPLVMIIYLLSIVPLPLGTIQGVAVSLTPIVARLAAYIGGASVIETRLYTALEITDSSGNTMYFRIAPVCSGVTSLLAMFSIMPLLLYIVVESNAGIKQKIKYTMLSIVSAAFIVFIGNVLRLASIIWIAKNYGYDVAIGAFHSLPSLIYVFIATIISIMLISRLLTNHTSRENKQYVLRELSPVPILAALLIGLVFIGLIGVMNSFVSQSIPEISIEKLLENPAAIVFNESDTVLVRDLPVPSIGEALGALDARIINVYYKGVPFSGYVEVAENPARFHGWHICLTSQGYDVSKSWVETFGDITINYILVSKNGRRMLLAYSLYKYPVTLMGKSTIIYVRVSLFTAGNDLDHVQNLVREILSSIGIHGREVQNPLPIIVLISNAAISLGIIIMIASTFYRVRILDLNEFKREKKITLCKKYNLQMVFEYQVDTCHYEE